MNVLAALLVLALAHDPRAFKMPKKAKAKPEALPVAASQLPAKPSEPAPVTEPAPPAQPVQAEPEPEPAPEPESKSPKPIMFEMPKAEPKAEAALATTNRQPATQAAPAPKPTRKKKPIPPRMFELPKKNVSN